MKEKITLYKQRCSVTGCEAVNAIKLNGWIVLASKEVEVEFPKVDSAEVQRSYIRQAIDAAKASHAATLEGLTNELRAAQ